MFHRKHIMKHTYCFTVLFLKLKFNIMATGTNGIATEGEAKSKLGYSGSVNTNKCCTKARAIVMGADSSKLTSYKDNQLVKYSDLSKFVPKYNCTFDFNRITAEGFVKINCGNKENWYSNSGIIAGFIDDNLASWFYTQKATGILSGKFHRFDNNYDYDLHFSPTEVKTTDYDKNFYLIIWAW